MKLEVPEFEYEAIADGRQTRIRFRSHGIIFRGTPITFTHGSRPNIDRVVESVNHYDDGIIDVKFSEVEAFSQ